MDVYKAISTRRSVRRYSSEPVSKDIINKIMSAVRQAPSGGNKQPWKFIVIEDNTIKDKLISFVAGHDDHNKELVQQAPEIIIACGQRSQINRGGYMGELGMLVDVSIASTYLLLAATTEGLETCWLGGYDNNKIKELLKIPEDYDVVALITIGYPKKDDLNEPVTKKRKSIFEIMSYNYFD